MNYLLYQFETACPTGFNQFEIYFTFIHGFRSLGKLYDSDGNPFRAFSDSKQQLQHVDHRFTITALITQF